MSQRILMFMLLLKVLRSFVALLIDKWLRGACGGVQQVLLQGGNLFFRIDATVFSCNVDINSFRFSLVEIIKTD